LLHFGSKHHFGMRRLVLSLAIIAGYAQIQAEDISERCLSLGCSNQIKGGKCYPGAQAGMDCIRSTDLCYPLTDDTDWHCCVKSDPDPQEKCEDVGCSDHFGPGQGNCYTLNTVRPAASRSRCISSDNLCQPKNLMRNALTLRAPPQPTCEWTHWIDRDNPTATGDWEDKIAPPYPGIPVGPGSKCEYSEYQVRLKGESQVYTDVSSIPGPWKIHDHPNGIVCVNSEQDEVDGCNGIRNQNSDKCCPDMEVKFCCQREVVEPEPCQCCQTPSQEDPCQWTDWIDRDNPTATCDCEHLLPGNRPVGPGTTCDYSKYQVRIKGSSQAYSDVNDLPGSWKIQDYPKGIKCFNFEQTIADCEGVKNQNSDKCCPDMEVKYCCK